MNIKYWRAAILAGIVVWLWSGFSWLVLPWHQAATKQFLNERAVIQALEENAPTGGVYRVPGFYVDEGIGHGGQSDLKEYFDQGHPYFYGVVHPQGHEMGYKGRYILSLVCDILAAFIVAWIVMKLKDFIFWNQVGLAMLIGLFAGIVMYRNEWVWGGFSFSFVAVSVMDLLIGWFFGGIVIARTLADKK